MRNAIALTLAVVACVVLSVDASAAERYVGTIPANSLNITGTYDAGAPNGVVQANTASVGPGSLIVLQPTVGACYCINQTDANQVTNCGPTNCIELGLHEYHKTSCPPTTTVKIPATLPDAGTTYGYTNLCTIYVVADGGVKVFTRQGNE